jgi:hypothetical protein
MMEDLQQADSRIEDCGIVFGFAAVLEGRGPNILGLGTTISFNGI